MSIHQPLDQFVDSQPLTLTPSAGRTHRSFDLHPALFACTVGGYLAYLGIMGATFMTGQLVIPFAIFIVTVVAAFAVPAMWARVEGPKIGRLPDWDTFMSDGVETWTGHLSGKSAAAQVLIMPVMLLAWGIVIAIIRATV